MDLLSQTIAPKYPTPLSQQYYSYLRLLYSLNWKQTCKRLRKYHHSFSKNSAHEHQPAPLLKPPEILTGSGRAGRDSASPSARWWRCRKPMTHVPEKTSDGWELAVSGNGLVFSWLPFCVYICSAISYHPCILSYIISYILHICTSNIKMILAYVTWYIVYISYRHEYTLTYISAFHSIGWNRNIPPNRTNLCQPCQQKMWH